MRRALGTLLLVAAGFLAVRVCAGPRPSVAGAWLEPKPDGYVAVAAVRNTGGDGEIEVIFRLRDRATGRIVPSHGTAQVRRGEEVQVRAFVPAPQGDWSLEAESEYPPR